jgi:hypothetical protein
MKNRDKYKSKKVTEYSQTKAATIKINQRLKIKEKRKKARDYQRKHRLHVHGHPRIVISFQF